MARGKPTDTRIARGSVEVINDWGLHARPAAALAKLAKGFDCQLTVTHGERTSPALSVAALLMLEATKGSKLALEAVGSDANEAIDAVVDLFNNGFGEQHVVLRGQGTRCGIAFGDAHVLLERSRDIPHYRITQASVKKECERLDRAIASERKRIKGMVKESGTKTVSEFGDLLLAMLDEEHISRIPKRIVGKELVNAEWALKVSLEEILQAFRASSDPVWQSKLDEYNQVMLRLVKVMLEPKARRRPKSKVGSNRIVVSGDIGPVEVLEYHRAGYDGFVSSGGSYNSHAAILARSLNFPAIVAVDHEALLDIDEDMTLVIDSDGSLLHVKPEKGTLAGLREQAKLDKKQRMRRAEAKRVGGPPRTVTRDGNRVRLMANIEFIDEIDIALAAGAEGIGLFRTEFLYIGRKDPPDEDEQYEMYRTAVERNGGLPVTFRTLDIGHDKVSSDDYLYALDSAMGIRAIRYCLREPAMFKEQLRALLRASKHGPMKIMFPMVSHQHEFEEGLLLLNEAMRELRMDASAVPPVGAMIEIPGSVFIMKRLATNCDFFSIGTNDLIQYTLAVDRNIAALAPLADPCHPAVIWLLGRIIEQGLELEKSVVMCGELAADPGMAKLFCTLGLRELSMTANKIAEIREGLGGMNIDLSRPLAERILSSTSAREVRELLDELRG